MSPSKKKVAKPKEGSLEATPQAVTPKIELPNDENKLFDEEDDQATSSMPDLSMEPKEAKETSLCAVWVHAIDSFFKLFYPFDERQLTIGELSTSYLENPWDTHSLEYLDQSHTESINPMEIHPSPSSGGPISSWGCIFHSPPTGLLPKHMKDL